MSKFKAKLGDRIRILKSEADHYSDKKGHVFQIGEILIACSESMYLNANYTGKTINNDPESPYCLLREDQYEVIPKEIKIENMFKKDDYIVVLDSPKEDEYFPRNYVFKQKMNHSYLMSQLDASGDEDNGWTRINFTKKDCDTNYDWRYATQEEIAEYEKLGKPFDVTTLQKKEIIPEYLECIGGEGMPSYGIIGRIYKFEKVSGSSWRVVCNLECGNHETGCTLYFYPAHFKPSTKEAYEAQVKKEEIPERISFYVKYCKEFTEDLYNKLSEWAKLNSEGEIRGMNDTYRGLEHYGFYLFDNWGLNSSKYEKTKVGMSYGVDNNRQGCKKELSISDLKHLIGYEESYKYEVVHCTTQEEWNFVTEHLDSKFNGGNNWTTHKEFSCKELNSRDYCSLGFYKQLNSKIYSFQEWCDKFGHEPKFMKKNQEFVHGEYYFATGNNSEWIIRFDKIAGDTLYDLGSLSLTTESYYGKSVWSRNYNDYVFRKATKEEIRHFKACEYASIYVDDPVEYAKKHYPIGTKVKSLFHTNECTITDHFHIIYPDCYQYDDDKIWFSGDSWNPVIYDKGEWAEIVSTPEKKVSEFKKETVPDEDWEPQVGDWAVITTLNSKARGEMSGTVGHVFQIDRITDRGFYYATSETWCVGASWPRDCIRKALPHEIPVTTSVINKLEGEIKDYLIQTVPDKPSELITAKKSNQISAEVKSTKPLSFTIKQKSKTIKF